MKNMISTNLKHIRDRHNLTQEQFAERIGVSRQTIAKWENGDSLPDIERCVEISMLFSVPLDVLATCNLDETAEPETNSVENKYVFGIVKVGERGQVVVPKHAREVYDIKPGCKILVLGDERGMAFVRIKNISNLNLLG